MTQQERELLEYLAGRGDVLAETARREVHMLKWDFVMLINKLYADLLVLFGPGGIDNVGYITDVARLDHAVISISDAGLAKIGRDS